MTDALQSDDLPLARTRLARIVGRDTENLDISDISRAVIEQRCRKRVRWLHRTPCFIYGSWGHSPSDGI